MKKTIVVLFDSWSFGYSFYKPYVPVLRKSGYKVVFAHMDSIQHGGLSQEKSVELSYFADTVGSDVDSYDIGDYASFARFCSEFHGCILFNLSMSHMENRLVNSVFFPHSDIVFVQHGNINAKDDGRKTAASHSMLNSIFSLCLFSKLRKIFRLFAMYSRYKGMMDAIKLAVQWAKGPRSFVYAPDYHHSLKVNVAFAFSASEKQYLCERYQFNPNSVFQIVNPEVYSLVKYLNGAEGRVQSLVFVDQALVESGLLARAKQSQDYRLCQSVCSELGVDFSVRPHPRTDKSRLIQEGLKINDTTLPDLVSQPAVYIGYNSSLLKTFALLGKSVIHLKSAHDFRSISIFSCTEKVELSDVCFEITNRSDLVSLIRTLVAEVPARSVPEFHDPAEQVIKILGSIDDV